MPLSTTTTSTTTTAITTTATTIPSTTATAIIEELQQRDEQSENANDDFTSTWKKTPEGVVSENNDLLEKSRVQEWLKMAKSV